MGADKEGENKASKLAGAQQDVLSLRVRKAGSHGRARLPSHAELVAATAAPTRLSGTAGQ